MRIIILAVVALLASSFEVPKVYSDFIDNTLEEVEALSFSTGVPVSIIYAQVIIESGAGRSNLAKKANNYFGIRCGDNWNGKRYKSSSGCWRSYKNREESFLDYACFLSDNYGEAIDKPSSFWVKNLKGYGSSGYWQKVGSIIKLYNLDKYE